MELRDGVDFERKIYVKQHAALMLRRDLKKVKAGEEIAIGTATDPYQPAERRYLVTQAILEEFALHTGLQLSIVTKSNLVLRDIDLLRQISQHNQLFVNLTITTLNVDLARILEPRAPRPDLRLNAIQTLNQAGVAAGVTNALRKGILPEHDVDDVVLVAAVWVNPEADDEEQVYTNNAEAVLSALGAGHDALPSVRGDDHSPAGTWHATGRTPAG